MRNRSTANTDLQSNIIFPTRLRTMATAVPLYDPSFRPVLFVLLVMLTALRCSTERTPSEPCKPDRLSTYRVLLKTNWSRERFPKQYPDWRPIAQFSKTLGRTHNGDYVLWKMGSVASKGVKDFAENGKSDLLDNESQGRGGVLDEFHLSAIPKGVGESGVTFFADGNHSKVSLITRLIPSPDWFIGIDSFDLCVLGKWVDMITLDLDPIDAGTDNGGRFTAPNWATNPQENIYRITAKFPNHPADSFYYPRLKKLPTIATVTFVKTKEYDLSQVSFDDAKEVGIRTNTIEEKPIKLPIVKTIPTRGSKKKALSGWGMDRMVTVQSNLQRRGEASNTSSDKTGSQRRKTLSYSGRKHLVWQCTMPRYLYSFQVVADHLNSRTLLFIFMRILNKCHLIINKSNLHSLFHTDIQLNMRN